MKRSSILLSVFLLLYSDFSVKAQAAQDRPNIIFIVADDMGYADLSIYGRKDYSTPVLDALAAEGMKFSQAYSGAPVCTPSRVSFMTGRYPARNPIGLHEPLLGDESDIDLGLSANTLTISSLLKKSGYKTALFGKWHLGFNPEFLPSVHGFDTFFGITAGAADYISHLDDGRNVLYENDKPIKEEGYLTDLISNHAIRYISETKGPFFISLQYNAPHWPWQIPGDKPYPADTPMTSGGSKETYAKMVERLDYNVGRVLKAVEEAGLKNNTLVIFTSDNGGERYSDMGPFRGKKMELWEGGIRVPAMVRWPGKVKPASQTDQVAVTMDWTVTILSAARVKMDNETKFDGMDLLPVLTGRHQPVERTLYWRITNRSRSDAYRSGEWKYVRTPQEEGLYNLDNDPGETVNLKTTRPDIFDKLKMEFQSLDREMLEPYVFTKKK